MTRKVLIVTGDGGDSYEALYACQRFLEAHWEPVIAAPARRRLHMVFHDTEPGWDTYVERPGHSVDAHMAITAVSAKEFAAIVILGDALPNTCATTPACSPCCASSPPRTSASVPSGTASRC